MAPTSRAPPPETNTCKCSCRSSVQPTLRGVFLNSAGRREHGSRLHGDKMGAQAPAFWAVVLLSHGGHVDWVSRCFSRVILEGLSGPHHW